MSAIPISIASTLDRAGFKRTAEFVRAVHRDGKFSSGGSINRYGSFSRGITHLLFNSLSWHEVSTSVRNASRYCEIDQEHPFLTSTWTHPLKKLGGIIKEGPLAQETLRIFDAACNHGQLVDHIIQRIERYKGMDIIEETIDSARQEAWNRFRKIGCVNYGFTQGDILDRDSYIGLPRDNNLVVCTGVVGNFRPRCIPILLDNLNLMLSNEDSSRIYLGYSAFNRDLIHRRNGKKILHDDGVDLVIANAKGINYRSFDPEQFIELVTGLGFDVESIHPEPEELFSNGNSDKLFRRLHLCLRKRK